MIIDNKKVKNITIQQGSVVKITDPNGVVLWQKESKPSTATPMYFENVYSEPVEINIQMKNDGGYSATLETSTDGVNWTNWGKTSISPNYRTINSGEKLYVRATADVGYISQSYKCNRFSLRYDRGMVNVGGNIMSLAYKNFEDKVTLTQESAFYELFYGLAIVDASKLVLPATTLSDYCYYGMFDGCSSLTTAPELPATELKSWCYASMFYDCESLTEAPELPANTLSGYCYYGMFLGCTSLTTAPELPATELANNCYYSMFKNCTSLTEAPILPAMKLATYCYYQMFQGCSSLTTAPELPATELAISCYNTMFRDCTALTQTPELPATKLVGSCYGSMFRGCTNLNKVRVYADDISAGFCINYWLDNVASSGDFYNYGTAEYLTDSGSGIPLGWVEHKVAMYFENVDSIPATILVRKFNSSAYTATLQTSTDGINWEDWGSTSTTALTKSVPVGGRLYVRASDNVGYFNDNSRQNYFFSYGKVSVGGNIMSLGYKDFEDKVSITNTNAYDRVFYNMVNLVDASKLVLPANELAEECYHGMFFGCTRLTTAPELPATTLAEGCYSYMFEDCKKLATAPELPATELANNCYKYMFLGCTSLTTAPSLPATTLSDYCYAAMFQNCTSLTEAPVLPATTLKDSCYIWMFDGCSSLTTAPALPATTLTKYCYQNMFQNCTSLTTAPELPATELVSWCYYGMFEGCTKLNKVTTYANNITALHCLTNWMANVSPVGDFYNNGGASYPSGSSGIPEGWTEHTTLN